MSFDPFGLAGGEVGFAAVIGLFIFLTQLDALHLFGSAVGHNLIIAFRGGFVIHANLPVVECGNFSPHDDFTPTPFHFLPADFGVY